MEFLILSFSKSKILLIVDGFNVSIHFSCSFRTQKKKRKEERRKQGKRFVQLHNSSGVKFKTISSFSTEDSFLWVNGEQVAAILIGESLFHIVHLSLQKQYSWDFNARS